MTTPYTQEKIENWVSDFCMSDGMRPFSAGVRDIAAPVLVTFLKEACGPRDLDPADVEEQDIKAALLGPVARLAIPESARREIPALCGALLTHLESEGRLGGGRAMGAFLKALTDGYLQEASGKTKPIVNPGSKLGRNDPCPCGSGKKYKKCCQKE